MTTSAPPTFRLASVLGGRDHVAAGDRSEWLALRGIGGSDVAAIRGRSPFGSAWDVWASKQPGVDRREDGDSAILDEGSRFESYIGPEYTHATGRPVVGVENLVVRHRECAWATASLDGFAFDDGPVVSPEHLADVAAGAARPAGWGVLEKKTYRLREATWGPTGSVAATAADAERLVAPYYADQGYWYLEVTGLPWLDFAVWLPRPWGFPELRWIRILPDARYQAQLLVEVARWRRAYLLSEPNRSAPGWTPGQVGNPPPIDDSDGCRRWLDRNAGPEKARKVVREATPREAELVASLAWLKDQRNGFVEQIRRVEAELTASITAPETDEHPGPANAVRIRGAKCSRVRNAGGFHFLITPYREAA